MERLTTAPGPSRALCCALALLAAVALLSAAALGSTPARAAGPGASPGSAGAASAGGHIADIPALPPTRQLVAARAQFLQLAETGVAAARAAWWDPARGWYDERIASDGPQPLATLWSIVPLFEALDAIAIADPSVANRRAVSLFANRAQLLYWNPRLRPVAGFSSAPWWRGPHVQTWFDDNGWWALAFLDAYRATGNPRYVTVAQRTMAFIMRSGWDPVHGGVWWDTTRHWKAAESLATATLLAARLYSITHQARYRRYEDLLTSWGQQRMWNPSVGLYTRSDRSPTLMNYVQSPMAAADAIMCWSTRDPVYCGRSASVAEDAAAYFPPEANMGPQYDAEWLRWLLELYSFDRNPQMYALAYYNAQRAIADAQDPDGLYAGTWDGSAITLHQADPTMLQVHAATVSVFAWLAATPPPIAN